ncbi:hypothetical protein BD410DRAFT_79701 [Rickenella mellea]|uniref:R3H domain-containing protein n=1 Tax=Rickenella mellea TaxID=50990 RepID=A0A4Y7PN90_9AGAM|nr:hypothetical protein BD410DRAFT_79701 [Rickenella mellea]
MDANTGVLETTSSTTAVGPSNTAGTSATQAGSSADRRDPAARNANRGGRGRGDGRGQQYGASTNAVAGGDRRPEDRGPRGRGRGRGRGGATNDRDSGRSSPSKAYNTQDDNSNPNPNPHAQSRSSNDNAGQGQGQSARGGGGAGRRRQINSRLTVPSSESTATSSSQPAATTSTPSPSAAATTTTTTPQGSSSSNKPRPTRPPRSKPAQSQSQADQNLTTRLTHALRTPPYPDCPICFSAIHPAQPIWSCVPDGDHGGEQDAAQCCYTPFHLKCIKSWASKSVKDMADALRARAAAGSITPNMVDGNGDTRGEWRCPGCQRRRWRVPSVYLCFCGKTPNPNPNPRLATPHSCGDSCSRARGVRLSHSHGGASAAAGTSGNRGASSGRGAEAGETRGGAGPGACGHPCPLACHPGPCPPCVVVVMKTCHCGRVGRAFRCSEIDNTHSHSPSSIHPPHDSSSTPIPTPADSDDSDPLSCTSLCGRPLSCGVPQHTCQRRCHRGECGRCEVVRTERCFCGREERVVRCGESPSAAAGLGREVREMGERCGLVGVGNSVGVGDGVGEERVEEREDGGKYACARACARPFACGVHRCTKTCHPLSPSLSTSSPSGEAEEAPPCPRAPESVSRCPCGKTLLRDLGDSKDGRDERGGGRTKCTDPIPTCGRTCARVLDSCGHACSRPCHEGPCPPCAIPITTPCRCGSSTKAILCSTLSPNLNPNSLSARPTREFLCDKPCPALRSCGRHQCARVCCPLASLALAAQHKGKGKKKAQGGEEEEIVDAEGWHVCDIVCGRMLACGNHRCEERDHKGPCMPCLQSSFEEIICPCGRTILDPPIPCGTQIHCPYPCARPPPPCGHPSATHSCHADDTPCPPCAFLTSKKCACGKGVVNNVRCSLERVSCGAKCGKLASCGFHRCARPCHGDDCGPCTAPCGKPRKLCLPAMHPCTLSCHAPASCDESTPCTATITISCACNRIQQQVACGRHSGQPDKQQQQSGAQLKCTNECAIAKRNARLADALGISSAVRDREGSKPVVWADELVAFARANAKFCTLAERTFSDFVTSEKKAQVLPYMPETRRKFVHDLASVYRMDTALVDQEPRRSIQIIRRIDTRIPTPLLSAFSAQSNTHTLGKLADLRALPAPSSVVRESPGARTAALAAPVARGWSSVAAAATPPPVPSTVVHANHVEARAKTPIHSPPVRTADRTIGETIPRTVTPVVHSQEPAEVPVDWETDA